MGLPVAPSLCCPSPFLTAASDSRQPTTPFRLPRWRPRAPAPTAKSPLRDSFKSTNRWSRKAVEGDARRARELQQLAGENGGRTYVRSRNSGESIARAAKLDPRRQARGRAAATLRHCLHAHAAPPVDRGYTVREPSHHGSRSCCVLLSPFSLPVRQPCRRRAQTGGCATA